MKRLNIIALVALFCLVITSCRKIDSKESGYVAPKSDLVGYWINEEGDPSPMCFKEDGTWVHVVGIGGRPSENGSRYLASDSYKVDGDKLTITTEEGNIMTANIEIDGDEMKLSAEGQTAKAKRITKEQFEELTKNMSVR